MNNSLGENMEEALSRLFPELVNRDWLTALRKTAHKLPPVIRPILECRLSADEPQVDLSQSFLAEDRHALHALLDPVRHRGGNWNNIRSFVRQWSLSGSAVERYLKGIWLEFDLLTGCENELTVPGLFLLMNDKSFSGLSDPKLEKTLERYFQLLLGTDQYQPFFSAYQNSIKILPEGVTPNQLGFMFSRSPVMIRALFQGIHKNQIGRYLMDIGLNRLPESFQSMLDTAYWFFRSGVLSLDFSPEITPRIGLELFPQQYISESSDDEFMDCLIRMGLCSKQKRKALATWPERIDPTSSTKPWPDHLMIQSLQKPTDCFSVMHRRINHFKMVCRPGHAMEAKVYLAYDHWAQFDNS